MGQRDEDHIAPPLLDDDEIGLLDESLRLLSDRSDEVLSGFYAALFAEAPALRALFPVAMDTQRDRLFRALTGAVRTLSDPQRLMPVLFQLGREHRKYGVRTEHYDVFGRALVTALRNHASDVWVPELEAAWTKAYSVLSDAMMAGARDAAGREPAWWKGEIVDHERRSDDIAVLTVRTDRPYDYEPGQYASVETAYRPRSWRTYSMATAPSADGLLEFHVRALGAGWVSGPLVWRARVGDQLRLGAAMGDLRVDHQSRRDLLCVAGGTGLAPIKAIVDGMSRWNTARRVTVFFGARRAADLYDLAALHRSAAINPWLTVVPVVSDEPSFSGEQGLLPDVVARHGRWLDHDVVVCGSPGMMRATLSRLGSLGVPSDRISYDVVGDHPVIGELAQVIDLRRSRASRALR
jgi:NAD(P)H-flavin reductase/hemoglobin-like flavoprotein